MNKAELLALLVDEYKKTVRLPNDITLRDYCDAIERETGKRIGAKKAARLLNERGDLEALKVTGDKGDTWVWRRKAPPTRKRKAHDRQQTRRTQQRVTPQ